MAKESKSDRFVRLAEARVNKLIKMIRLLGNCSMKCNYEFTEDQVSQIFSTLNDELYKARAKYSIAKHEKKPFSLSDESEEPMPEYPHTDLQLPDGTTLRATAIDDENFPAINIDLIDFEKNERVCFVEFNPERSSCHKVCIGVYQSDKDEPVFYEQYIRDKDESVNHSQKRQKGNHNE